MAIRIANKLQNFVNHVVLKNSRQFQPFFASAKGLCGEEVIDVQNSHTKFMLNEQTAQNKLITDKHNEQVLKDIKLKLGPVSEISKWATTEKHGCVVGARYYGKMSRKQCSAGNRKGEKFCADEEVLKVRKFEERKAKTECDCVKFTARSCCEVAEDIRCIKPYVFKACRKRPAPYPSFSEQCYEGPFIVYGECKTCPYSRPKHPTYKAPKDKFGKPGRKMFHTDVRVSAGLKFNYQRPLEDSESIVDVEGGILEKSNPKDIGIKCARRKKNVVNIKNQCPKLKKCDSGKYINEECDKKHKESQICPKDLGSRKKPKKFKKMPKRKPQKSKKKSRKSKKKDKCKEDKEHKFKEVDGINNGPLTGISINNIEPLTSIKKAI